MALFKAFAPNAEVGGKSIRLVLDAMGLFERMAKNIFAKYGIVDITDAGWYSQQAYLDVYREIYEKVGAKTMRLIGKQVPEKVLWPPNIRTILESLASIDVAYHMNHRGGEIGYYRFESAGERTGKMVCYNPYPCPFDEGLIEATANKFAPPGTQARVRHDEPQSCRMKDGDACTYLISW